MSGLQEEYLQHQTKIEQLRLSIQYIRWYLVSLILLCLISAIIFFCYFTSYMALLHKDLKCKAPLIEPNLRRNLGKWST